MQWNVESFRQFWKTRGRLLTLVGAFLLPLVCASPLFQLPFEYRVHVHSPVGLLYRAIQQTPLLMTEIGFLVWLSWRFSWSPSRAQGRQMFVATLLALVALPVVCRGLQYFSAELIAEDWRSAVMTTWIVCGPPQAYVLMLAQAFYAFVIFLVLRGVARKWTIGLIQPGQETPKQRPPQFSIAHVLIVTGVVALSIGLLPSLLRNYFWADQVDFFYRLGSSLVVNAVHAAFLAITVCVVAWLGLRSLDVMIPRLAIIVIAVVGWMHLEFRIASVLPTFYGAPMSFSVFDSIPSAIALVVGSTCVFALFRSLGLSVVTARKNETSHAELRPVSDQDRD